MHVAGVGRLPPGEIGRLVRPRPRTGRASGRLAPSSARRDAPGTRSRSGRAPAGRRAPPHRRAAWPRASYPRRSASRRSGRRPSPGRRSPGRRTGRGRSCAGPPRTRARRPSALGRSGCFARPVSSSSGRPRSSTLLTLMACSSSAYSLLVRRPGPRVARLQMPLSTLLQPMVLSPAPRRPTTTRGLVGRVQNLGVGPSGWRTRPQLKRGDAGERVSGAFPRRWAAASLLEPGRHERDLWLREDVDGGSLLVNRRRGGHVIATIGCAVVDLDSEGRNGGRGRHRDERQCRQQQVQQAASPFDGPSPARRRPPGRHGRPQRSTPPRGR